MQIARRGATADHGWTKNKIKLNKIRWDTTTDQITLSSQTAVQGFAGPGRHIFTISLTLEEISELISELSKMQDEIGKEELAEALEPITPALVRLTSTAARVC